MAPAVVIPEMDPIPEKHETKMTEFLATLFAHWEQEKGKLPLSWSSLNTEDRRILAKFLTARKWNIQHALDMAIEHEKWKETHQVDELPMLPTPFPVRGYDVDDVNQRLGLRARPCPINGEGPADFFDKCHKTCGIHYQSAYHYWDKTGHPVFYQIVGRVQARGVVKQYQKMCAVGEKATVPVVRYHIMENEVGLLLTRYNDLRNQQGPTATEEGSDSNQKKWEHIPDRRVLGVTVVIDCDGLGYQHVYTPAIELLRAIFATDAANYPEFVHRIWLVNCPSMIKFLFNLVRGALDVRVQQKITFLSSAETLSVLQTVIDLDKIPSFLGGSCNCEGGCVTLPAGAEADEAPADGETVTEDITVHAGKILTKTVEVQQGEEVTWEFVSTTGYDIKFSVTFVAAGEDDEQGVEVVARHKLKDDSHSYRATAAGKLVLVWDNHSSWFKPKKLQMRIAKQVVQHEAVHSE